MKIAIRDICTYINASSDAFPNGDQVFATGVAIDSRKVQPGDIFFAFKGERVDGEQYVAQAIQNGALAAVVSEQFGFSDSPSTVNVLSETNSVMEADLPVIKVPDVQWALQELAKGYFKGLNIPVIAISGSVGKTSTKDMIASILSSKLRVFKTKGNYNNEIGLPLMLLQISEEDQVAVLELGMNHFGELSRLSELTNHQIAILTNIGTAHIEFFGSKEAIFRAKMEITDSLSEDGVLIVNGKDEYLASVEAVNFDVVKIGRECDAIYAESVEITLEGTRFELKSAMWSFPVFIPLWGEHQVTNALLAVAVALRIGMGIESIVEALANLESTPMRFSPIKDGQRIWINDAYNASYDSISASAKTFQDMPFENRWLILGDVFECGEQSDVIHAQIGQMLNNLKFEMCLFIGEGMKFAHQEYQGNSMHFNQIDEAIAYLKKALPQKCSVLVKASRGMALERIIQQMTGE